MAEAGNLIFQEEQRFNLWLRLLIACSMGIGMIINCFALYQKLSEQNATVLSIVFLIAVAILLPIAIAVLFLILRLETEVHPDGLYVRFFPFHVRFKKFTSEDLSEYYARTYRPLLEYGGWGIRCGFGKKGMAYNVSGNKGVQLVLKNGKRLLIGSQRSDELAEAISSFAKNSQS